jgi:anti-anti-sigma factor
MSTPLSFDTGRDADGAMVLTVTGEIDLSNVARFADALDAAIADGAGKPVTVDLGAVDYLDSGAINALFTHAPAIRLVTNTLLLPVLTISGLTKVVAVEQA